MHNIPAGCHCGAVTGTLKKISQNSGNRLVCYCNSCQAFARILRQDNQTDRPPILDADGGTEVFQIPPSCLEIDTGHKHIACMRLTPKGTYRWYTKCCQTPIGNTLTANVPFIGLIHSFIRLTDTERQQVLGNVQGYIHARHARHARHATGNRINAVRHSGMPLTIGLKIMLRLLHWKLRGHSHPHALFNDEGTPLAHPEIIHPDNTNTHP